MIGALMLAPAAANSSLDQDVTVKVGLLTPQTGGLSAYSGGFEKAAALAVSDLNNDSAFDGYTFELSVYDTATTPCLLYTSPSPRDATLSRMPSSA